MAGWSSLAKLVRGVTHGLHSLKPVNPRLASATCQLSNLKGTAAPHLMQQIRMMAGHGPRLMPLTPSRWQWHKFKDLLHFYVMVGAIPVGLVIFYANVFIGPATLAEIPEDYEPKHWEYYRHPIQRWFARHLYSSHQQEYEKFLHYMFEENEKAQIRKLEKKVRQKMSERNDYQAYYYRPAIAKYHRISKEAAEYLDSIKGD